jgi:hypothetical protein
MKCLRINKKKFDQNEGWDCPICDWHKDIPRSTPRPSLSELTGWEESAMTLPFQPDELALVMKITATAKAWVASIQPFIQDRQRHTISRCRFYLRKMEGAEVFLPNEYNLMRHFAHALAPVTATPPPVVAESKVIKKPRAKKPKPDAPQHDPDHRQFSPYDPHRPADIRMPQRIEQKIEKRPLAMELSQIAPQPHQPTHSFVPNVPRLSSVAIPQPPKGTFAPPSRTNDTPLLERQVQNCGSCHGEFIRGERNEPLACSQCRRLHHTQCIGKYGGRLYPAFVWYVILMPC